MCDMHPVHGNCPQTVYRRRVDPLGLVARPGVLPTEQPQPSRSELARVLSRSLRSNPSGESPCHLRQLQCPPLLCDPSRLPHSAPRCPVHPQPIKQLRYARREAKSGDHLSPSPPTISVPFTALVPFSKAPPIPLPSPCRHVRVFSDCKNSSNDANILRPTAYQSTRAQPKAMVEPVHGQKKQKREFDPSVNCYSTHGNFPSPPFQRTSEASIVHVRAAFGRKNCRFYFVCEENVTGLMMNLF